MNIDIDPITPEHIAKGGDNSLGPHYFMARDAAEKIMQGWESSFFEPAIKKFTDEAYSDLLKKVEDWIISDVESNVQGKIWRTVDQIVKGILSGEKWVVDRYALGQRYDCDTARAAIAKHVPRELQDARIADLEAEVAQLKDALKWARR